MNQAELIKLMEQWQQTDPALYKTNIKALCDQRGIKPRQIEKALGVTYSSARSYTNPAHKARIEFITALKLAELLNVDVRNFLEEN